MGNKGNISADSLFFLKNLSPVLYYFFVKKKKKQRFKLQSSILSVNGQMGVVVCDVIVVQEASDGDKRRKIIK